MAIIYDNWGGAHADFGPYVNTNLAQSSPSSRINRPVVVKKPTRGDFGTPSREGIDSQQADMTSFLTDYNNPRGTDRFSNLLGAASSSLARQSSERTRIAQENSARRGFVGGYSGEDARAERDSETERARIGFDAANTISKDSAALYTGAAGRYADLVSGYNEQVGAGDRAFGQATQQRESEQAAALTDWRHQRQQQSQFETTTAEGTRQFDVSTLEGRREFDAKLGEDARQFQITADENKREFDQETAARKREFDTTTKEGRDKWEADLAQRREEFKASFIEDKRRFEINQQDEKQRAMDDYNLSIGRPPSPIAPPTTRPAPPAPIPGLGGGTSFGPPTRGRVPGSLRR